eukprot:TRINITY_DN4956_c0_g1_i2.p1 TRINITY_DN4956_c0_g1~~TRINITY_DN4956_c0_g1_i2.p1  ORF type:complete len:566 (-),score=113.51 TRINITY_DN4956_c0_g1_i2:94-1641(-)
MRAAQLGASFHSADLLAQLEQLEHDDEELGHGKTIEARTDRLQEALLPLYRVASKDADDTVDSETARYLLHRLFVNRHGWFVHGVEKQGAKVAQTNVGEAVASVERFSLRQLAHFGATLETLIHLENIERLNRSFEVYGFAKDGPRETNQAEAIIEAYMIFFVANWLPKDSSFHTLKKGVERQASMWAETRLFAKEVREAVFEWQEGEDPVTLWDACLQVVEEIAERYGRWQNKDCLKLRSSLHPLEVPGTGRVPLKDFWGPLQHNSSWTFDESLPYLKQLGAVEGEAPHYNVVIPNYVYSAANCLAGSKYYDVCCINDCENILGEVERRINAPSASPRRLFQVVSQIPSASVEAPRRLPDALVARLKAGAAAQGGEVFLHGRLFSQFLHHAYPLECPYPHASVSEKVTEDDWIHHTARESYVDRGLLSTYLSETENISSVLTELPWTDEENAFMQNVWSDGESTMAMEDDESSSNGKWYVFLTLFAGAAVQWARSKKAAKGECENSDGGHVHVL